MFFTISLLFSGPLHRVFFAYDLSGVDSMDKVVHNLVNDWGSIAHLYEAVLDFSEVYDGK